MQTGTGNNHLLQNVVRIINSLTKAQLEEYLSKQSLDDLMDLKKTLDDAYYNRMSLTDDWKYDLVKDKIFNDTSVGAPLHESEVKVSLPVWLGSLDKVKPENTKELNRWRSKFGEDVVVMDKLDGVSCLYVRDLATGKVSLFTRGDGAVGKDISYILEYIAGIPTKHLASPQKSGQMLVRGELVLPKKYNIECSRNIVSGAVKSKRVTKHLNKVVFVAHEYIHFQNDAPVFLLPLVQVTILQKHGFYVVSACTGKVSELSSILNRRLAESEFDIDGIVVHSQQLTAGGVNHSRNTSGNPAYSFAYKEDRFYQTRVRDVTWSVSKSGLFKPVVVIVPVNILGAMVSCASGYNAKFIFDNKIGRNAVVTVTRSGEVIPKIVDVITPSADSDLVYPAEGSYKWNDNRVELVLVDSDGNAQSENEEQKIKKLVHFAQVTGVQHLGLGTAKKLVAANIDTVAKLLLASKKDLEKLDSFGDLSVERLHSNIHTAWSTSELATKMYASSCFPDGLGLKNITAILNAPKMLTEETHKVAVQKYVEGYPVFESFMKTIGDKIATPSSQNTPAKAAVAIGKIVFTGFRDSDLEKRVEQSGIGQMSSAVSGKTALLVVDSLSSSSSKATKAAELGIKIMTKDDFLKTYF